MRINGTFGFETQGLPDRPDRSARSGKTDSGGKTRESSGGALIHAAHNSFVSLAMQSEEVNLRAVEEARRLLENGQLDTPEAVRRTAEAILDLGF
ncbi:MAG: hypothetical protein ACLFVU_10455 [Phycisphaerae bacterium]